MSNILSNRYPNWYSVPLSDELKDELRDWYADIFEDDAEYAKYNHVTLRAKNNGIKKFSKVKFYYKSKYSKARHFSTVLDLYKDTYIIPKEYDDYYNHYGSLCVHNKFTIEPVPQTDQYKNIKYKLLVLVNKTKIPIIKSRNTVISLLNHSIIKHPKPNTKPKTLHKVLVSLPKDLQREVLSYI